MKRCAKSEQLFWQVTLEQREKKSWRLYNGCGTDPGWQRSRS